MNNHMANETTALQSTPSAHVLACMEILGGISSKVQSVACPGLDLWISTQPYRDEPTGGDVHYVSLCGGGITTRILLADVSGHGSHVHEYSEFLRKLVKRYINAKSQAEFMSEINRSFADYAQLSRFATSVFATYLSTKKSLELCIAGHPRPLWYQANAREWKYLGESAKPLPTDIGITNVPVGIDDEADFQTFQFHLGVNDLLVLYTDSLTESQSPAGQFLGEAGLLQIVQSLNPDGSDIHTSGEQILSKVSRFRDDRPADDDESILVIRHNAQGRKQMGISDKIDVYAKFFGLKSY